MDDDEDDERRRKRARLQESREAEKLLQTLDYQDHRDLASYLLLAARYQKTQSKPSPTKRGRTRTPQQQSLALESTWTAWPLPSNTLTRPEPVPSSSLTEPRTTSPNPLHAQIEAAVLRLARSQIQKDGNADSVSAEEHPPYHVTREVTKHVISKVDNLLHALGRVKYGQLTSKRVKQRIPKSGWQEFVGISGISKTVASEETLKRITERCNKLFDDEETS